MTYKKIKIVTDSVCDIPDSLLEQWNISVIPCYVNYGGESYADDGKELDRTEFYQMLPDMEDFPSTAAPPPGLAEDILNEAIEGYDHVISIHAPEKLSATINNVRLGAESLSPERVTVIDSLSVSMGQGMQVLAAAEVAQETGDVEAVVAAVERVRRHQRLYAAFATMEYLRRSGRLNNVVAAVGSLLQIKPIVQIEDGVVEPAHRVRTFKKALDKLHELTQQETPLDRLVVLHVLNEEGAQQFAERLSDLAPQATMIAEVGPTLGTHVGPGSIGVVTLNRGWLG